MKYTTVLFDLDGTLTRSEKGITRSALYACEKLGFTGHTEEEFKVFIGPPLFDSFRKVVGMSDEQAEQALTYYRERFSTIGYAENEEGRVYTSFGSLSADGGENRLNVAITRAKSKIIVVTSIEPEALKVEGAKNLGPKLLKKYLMYARAVSSGNSEEKKAILSDITNDEFAPREPITKLAPVEEKIKERLEKLGYKVDTALGDKNSRISLAIYDEESDRYLVGIELDKDALLSSDSAMERDVYKPKFLESRGWTIVRVWCRDWWHSPSRVIKIITTLAEKNRK